MSILWKIAKFTGIFLLGVVVMPQVVWVIRSSKTTAQPYAVDEFNRECPKLHLACQDFDGPFYKGKGQGAYDFVWKNRINGDQIFVSVFVPFDIETGYAPHDWTVPKPQP